MNIDKKKKPLISLTRTRNLASWAILIGIAIIYAIILYPNLVVPIKSYTLGDVVENDIKATRDFFIEDKEATGIKQKEAALKVLTVYDHDSNLASKLIQNVKQAFADLRKIIQSEKKNQIKNLSLKPEKLQSLTYTKKRDFEKKLGIDISDGAFAILKKEAFSENISNGITFVLRKLFENGVVTNKEILLKEIKKGIVLRTVGTGAEQIVQSLKQFYGHDQAKTMVRIVGQPFLKNFNYILRNLIVDFSQRLIQPNITLNRNETEIRKREASEKIKPILYKIKAGEMILREGERVTKTQLLKLKALQAGTKWKKALASTTGAATLILSFLLITYILLLNHNQIKQNHQKNLLFIATILIVFIFIAKVSASFSASLPENGPLSLTPSSIYFGIPLASSAMTICLFLGLEVAVLFAVVIATATAMMFQNRFDLFIYFLLSSLMAAYWIQNCRERKVFIKAGIKLGLLNIVVVTALNVYMSSLTGVKLLWDGAFAFQAGIVAGMITAGIAPLIEIAFDYKTDITLLELANLDQPLLRRLMLEVPGTYHHSVIVGSMVEAAASEIRANPLLAKVCGYYHDIGKLKNPLYFIENQQNGKNKHDKLAPSMSSLILISHIKNGVEIAGQNKLGQNIIDTIRQHHGTSLIRFFYEKAKQLKGEDAVDIDNFRYPGPKPLTREAGLVMLADVAEAASRTLQNPTPSRIQGLVQNLIDKIFSDGQLDNCELTLKDLHNIAKSFNKILNGIYHHRIDYPENLIAKSGKGKNGSPDRQQANQAQAASSQNTANGSGYLKRLGLP